MRQLEYFSPLADHAQAFIRELVESEPFQAAVQAFREKWEIYVGAELFLRDIDAPNTDSDRLLKNKKFMAALFKLQKKFGLNEEWSQFMEEYIFIDAAVYKKTSSFWIEKRTDEEADAATGEPAFYLRLFPTTTKEDVNDAWNEIQKFIHNGEKKTRRKPNANFNRDRDIYRLARAGARIEQIDAYIEGKYGKGIDHGALKTALSRYMKKMGIKERPLLTKKIGDEQESAQVTMEKIFPSEANL